MRLLDEVRSNCRSIAETADYVTIDLDAWREPPAVDRTNRRRAAPTTCSSSTRSTSARAGSRRCASGPGCRATARSRPPSPSTPVDDRRAGQDLAAVAAVLGQDAGHPPAPLRRGAARTRPLPGRPFGARPGRGGPGSAERLAELLARGMRFFDDRGFYKRAQIVPSDLALAGLAEFGDLDRLTIFADNLVPHVLRVDGVLRYDAALAARIDAGELLPQGQAEREIRACALHACELIGERTRAAASARHPALEPRPGARVQGGAAASHAQRLLLPAAAEPPASGLSRRPSRARGGAPGASPAPPRACGRLLATSSSSSVSRLASPLIASATGSGRCAQSASALRAALVHADRVARIAHHGGVGRHVVDDDRVGADLGARAHDDRAEQLGAGTDHDLVPDGRVALAAREAGAAERDAPGHRHVVAHLGRLADHHAGSVVDEQPAPDARRGWISTPVTTLTTKAIAAGISGTRASCSA